MLEKVIEKEDEEREAKIASEHKSSSGDVHNNVVGEGAGDDA